MKDILYFFSDMNAFSIALRLLLAMLLGSLVGVERANKRYAAGIRTFALVCMGSALATITGLYLSEISAYPADIGRIPAQLLCGIGFLGAGTIIVTDRRQVRGRPLRDFGSPQRWELQSAQGSYGRRWYVSC